MIVSNIAHLSDFLGAWAFSEAGTELSDVIRNTKAFGI